MFGFEFLSAPLASSRRTGHDDTEQMSFQFRKNMHMLFLALLVALCFHSVHFRFVGGGLLVWYVLDRFYFTTKQ